MPPRFDGATAPVSAPATAPVLVPTAPAMIPAALLSACWGGRFGTRAVISTGLLLLSTGLVVLASVGPHTRYSVVAVGLVLLGTGMGNVTAPATGAVMTSLPVAKAGVGSAVNDTSREVGGALGIPVLGSLAASAYRANLEGAVAGLREHTATVATQSLGAALEAAGRMGGDGGAVLADAARAAYTDAMNVALFVVAAVALLAVGVVRRYLPPPE